MVINNLCSLDDDKILEGQKLVETDHAKRLNDKDRLIRFHPESLPGFGFAIRSHSPLNALTSQLERPIVHISHFSRINILCLEELTFID